MKYLSEYALWWPNNEGKERELFLYQLRRVTDVDVAVRLCRTTGVCVQAGGFMGMWPRRLAKYFEYVHTFEPVPYLYECLKKNVAHLPQVICTNAALTEKVGITKFIVKTGGRSTPELPLEAREKTIPVATVTIDSLDLIRCDAIFLDVERSEFKALDGARKTIERFGPVVTLETKEDTEPEYDRYMADLGYTRAAKVHADAIYTRKTK